MMYISGFMCVRHAVIYDYPLSEAICSLLPLVDELVIALGDGKDNTIDQIKSIHPSLAQNKIRIIHTIWDESLRRNGEVLSQETNKALEATNPKATWLVYLQADEVLHEEELPAIRNAMKAYQDDLKVEGLLFSYRHFYGDYRYVANSRLWYDKEIRIIRNNENILSYKDAQGFRKKDNRKLRVKEIPAHIHHYGWVRNPSYMQKKIAHVNMKYLTGKKLASEQVIQEQINKKKLDYHENIDVLNLFSGTHPKVMNERIAKKNWKFTYDTSKKKFRNLKYRLLYYIETLTGWRPFSYKNYHKI